ncbi:hypothetical protein CBS63078_112 [Aspergillus niger]|nr:hypothetical protein CBS11350_11079 [Aspergillus niger]KAI2856360.1 hypothetical protein CBS12448_6985 [Aspergillus niger]KAI2883024.1 hypothetical protein CBS13152_8633 [Aspergillus niger]KAI2921117.1 hypothetical protein CBS147320_7810 [Aspergillus niger]KAI2944110.1 hypothetical protein CBS63078_112 [Aspergillus niger]
MMKELSHEVLFRKGKNSGEVVISQGYYFMGVESLIGQEMTRIQPSDACPTLTSELKISFVMIHSVEPVSSGAWKVMSQIS